MEMGNSPGTMAFHSHAFKLMKGAEELPRYILDYTEKHYPKYLEAPKEWAGPMMASTEAEFKKMLDKRRQESASE